MYWPLLIKGQWSELELWIKIVKSCLLGATAGLNVDHRWPDIVPSCREFTSIVPCQSVLRGADLQWRIGAMPGSAERHKQLISTFCQLGKRSGSYASSIWQPKTKYRTSMSTKDYFKNVSHSIHQLSKLEFCQIHVLYEYIWSTPTSFYAAAGKFLPTSRRKPTLTRS